MPYNEEDTKLHLITPALQHAGWIGSAITMEYPVNPGAIVLHGDSHKQMPPKKADYLLRYGGTAPIAVVEAKAEDCAPGDGLQQAMGYAEKLGLYFAYATNGRGWVEWDFTANAQTEFPMDEMPRPETLWQRHCAYLALEANRPSNPLLQPYWRDPAGKKSMRYYQEVAVNRVLEAILKGQKRILINLATGTGKTFIAFQTVWKLIKSGHFANKRVLFIADRIVLRGQAYNAFEPFKESAGDPREEFEGGRIKRGRNLYFAIYQSLYAEGPDGFRAYEDLPTDYFDLIIIDECHRSGFGTWNAILQHFPDAVQLGMTATPKRTDNVDTYSYFGEPVFTYSLGQGIDDGFLANYKVHRVITNYDANGLNLKEAVASGASITASPDAVIREKYEQSSFERDIQLPERVALHCKDLVDRMRLFDRMEKTIVFCASQDHALAVRDHLNRLNVDLDIPNYAVRIVSEESDGQTWLKRFQTVEKRTPVVATTVDLLSTGMDAPSVRNIVFFATIHSVSEFKQRIGRGTRLCEDTDKFWFRILDYTGATALFDEWDTPTSPPGAPTVAPGPRVCWLGGRVTSADTGLPIADAVVTAQLGPNEILQQRTGVDGQFLFSELPAGELTLMASAYGHNKIQTKVVTAAGQPCIVSLVLPKHEQPKDRMVQVTGLKVQIVEQSYSERDASGRLVSPEDYLRKVRSEITSVCANLFELRARWSDAQRRKQLLSELEERQVALDVLTEILKRPDVDSYDLLAHVGYDAGLHSREERAVALFNLHQEFFAIYNEPAREILRSLIERYVLCGIDEVLDPRVFTLPPIRKEARQVAPLFGGMKQLVAAREEMIRRLYVNAA